MIEWILEHLGIVVVVVLFIVQMVRGVLEQLKNRQPPPMRREAGDEERRVREVQEQIRRQIAARKAAEAPAEAPPMLPREEARPIPRAETTQMPEPFGGGPLGRMLEELQRKAQQHVPPPPVPTPVVVERRNLGELERQQRLADELKAVEATRHALQRRAAHVAADQLAVIESEPALRTAARQRLLDDLGDPQSLRRAFVLKEVLGAPVGLR
jgi:hypothetical protein